MSDDSVNHDHLVGRSWSAYSAMINEAQALENTAQRLRERAAELHLVLDPPAEKERDS
ncbi:MAG: hypothetical protein K5905_00190 [Roseibium sp.]|uniref:hypothetical protein n=1 Tax=Roseibium sp. TaxID=1936156 RepID=UPI0026292CD2|nr:hypothetical protein [Roseibium sp.]MCV0423868.1 hypothetical protein [Roseibium sp.]